MSFIASLTSVGLTVGVTGSIAAPLAGAGILAAAGAGLGAGTSALMGGDPGEGALMGAITGPLMAPLMPAGAAAGAGTQAAANTTAQVAANTTAQSAIEASKQAAIQGGGIVGGLGANGTAAANALLTPAFMSSGGGAAGGALGGSAGGALGANGTAAANALLTPAFMSSGGGAAGGAAPGFFSTIGGKAAIGAGIGGLGGAITNPDDPMKGALIGAGAGALGGAGSAALAGQAGAAGTLGQLGTFAAEHPYITSAAIGAPTTMALNSMTAGPSAEEELEATNASDRARYLRYLQQYRPSLPPGYAGGGLANLIPGGQNTADWLVKYSLPGMIFDWQHASDLPLFGELFNDPNTANLTPEEKKKLMAMAAAQGQQPQQMAATQGQPMQQMARGGIADLGGYAAGGIPNLLRGPGDGVSDSIPASIAGRQPARLASGEYVVPSRIVSELGNGSTDAGARRLDTMVQKVNAGRSKTLGGKKYAKDTRAYKHLPV